MEHHPWRLLQWYRKVHQATQMYGMAANSIRKRAKRRSFVTGKSGRNFEVSLFHFTKMVK